MFSVFVQTSVLIREKFSNSKKVSFGSLSDVVWISMKVKSSLPIFFLCLKTLEEFVVNPSASFVSHRQLFPLKVSDFMWVIFFILLHFNAKSILSYLFQILVVFTNACKVLFDCFCGDKVDMENRRQILHCCYMSGCLYFLLCPFIFCCLYGEMKWTFWVNVIQFSGNSERPALKFWFMNRI